MSSDWTILYIHVLKVEYPTFATGNTLQISQVQCFLLFIMPDVQKFFNEALAVI